MLIIHIFFSILVALVVGIVFGSIGSYSNQTFLLFLPWLGVIDDYKMLLGTLSFVSILPYASGAFYKYYKAGKVNYKLAIILAIGVLIGGYVGATITLDKLSDKEIKTLVLIWVTFITILIHYRYWTTTYFEKEIKA
jgi:uncharacterized membrane protein YfcA